MNIGSMSVSRDDVAVVQGQEQEMGRVARQG
jgi:hypothetical protein